VQRRSADGSRAGAKVVLVNLPGYPGRITPAADGTWWAAMPCLRSRATELMFEFPAMVDEMVNTTEVDSWLVPRLRIEVPHRAPLQVGELSVLGPSEVRAGRRTGQDVVVFTGGRGSFQGRFLGEDGRARVRDFGREGGGYVGICAGAYMALQGDAEFNKVAFVAGRHATGDAWRSRSSTR